MATTIEWLGGESVVIKGPGDRCFINPPEKDLGKKKLTRKDGISLLSYTPTEHEVSHRNPYLIASPGEYDVGGFFVVALRSSEEPERSPNLFIVRYERRSIVYIDNYPAKELGDSDLEALGNVDVLIIPLDEGAEDATMGAEKAIRITNQIDPRLVIPVEREGGRKAVATFAKEMGSEAKPDDSLTIKQNETLDAEETEVVVLKPSA